MARYFAHSADLALSGGLDTAVAAGPAVCALAEQYVLRRVGGASSAAVTAAFAAAAELGRTAEQPRRAGTSGSSGTTGTTGTSDSVRPGFAGLAAAVSWLAGAEGTSRSEPQSGAGPSGGPDGADGGDRTGNADTGAAVIDRWRLARMFRPEARTAALFRLVLAATGPRHGRRRLVRLGAAAVATLDRGAWIVVGLLWLGALTGGVGTIVAIGRSPHVAGPLLAIAAVPLIATFGLAATFGSFLIVAHTVRAAVRHELDDDGFGLIGGAGTAEPDQAEATRSRWAARWDRAAGSLAPAGTQHVVCWIADRLDDLAAVPVAGEGAHRYALTFGELWLGRMGGRGDSDVALLRRAAQDPRRRAVDLMVVAADLSAGRPRLLPFAVTERPEQVPGPAFQFCHACLSGLVPARVIDQMVLLSPGATVACDCPRHPGQALHDLPDPWDLPVVFAVRLAAAVPGLLRPVPLYAPERATESVRTHWFADGTLTGGLPPRVFDVPLPRWPTFSIAAVASPDDVTVPDQDAAPQPSGWRPVAGPQGLLAAALAAALGWRDSLAADAPGLRGRRGAVRGSGQTAPFLDGDELGRLAVRGYHAGRQLRERFTAADRADGEDGHTRTDRFRWIRLRAALTEYRQLSLSIGASLPLYTDLALAYRVPPELCDWFSPRLTPGHADPAWGDAVAAVTHLRSLSEGGVLDWDTDWGAPPSDPHLRLI